MKIEKALNGDVTVFAITGKIDTNSAAELEKTLLDNIGSSKTPFQVDMTEVNFISSTGLRAFLSAQKAANAAGVSMEITGVSKQILEIFDITGFSGVLAIR